MIGWMTAGVSRQFHTHLGKGETTAPNYPFYPPCPPLATSSHNHRQC